MDPIDDADCEVRDDWGFAQDVNAWSSLGYVAVGVVIAASIVRRGVPRAFLALAALAVLEGVGSMLYHGRGGDTAQLLHDAPLLGVVGFVAGWHAGRLVAGVRGAVRGAWTGAVAGVVVGAVAAASAGGPVTNAGALTGLVVIVATEWLARRRGRRSVWNGGLLALTALGGGAWLLGTSDSPLCAARSWAQPHALWHLLSAVALLWWSDRAMEAEWPAHAPRIGRGIVDRVVA